MKFLVPKTLEQAFSPMLLVNWLFGIGVIEYPMDKPRPIISALWSAVNFLIYLGFLRMANFSQVVTFHGSKIAANNYRILDSYFCGTFVVISMFAAHIGAKMVRTCRHKLSDINNRLKTLEIPTDFEVAFKTQIVHMSLGFSFMVVLIVLDFKYIGFDLPNELSRIGFLLVSHYLLVFAFVVDANFCTCIRYLGNRFRHLNALVGELESRAITKTTTNRKFIDQRYSSAINGVHRNNSLAIRAAEKQWLLHVIGETRKIHRGLCGTAMILNRALGIQMLFSVALSSGMITALFYTSYIIASELPVEVPFLETLIAKTIVLMWISSHAMKVLLIVDACETTSFQALRTGELISNLRSTTTCDEDIRDEINIFSLQLIQNPLNFTASGFFPLRYSLVRGVIGSVTTYLVIMIQMRDILELRLIESAANSTMLVQSNESDSEHLSALETHL